MRVAGEGEQLEKLRRQEEEIERLRGLLVTRDAELGAARGRAKELEQGTLRLMGILRRIRALLAAILAKAATGLRRLAGVTKKT
jgi:hypothetical protein